ncbi:hypothetical protein F442_02379 [Phytophthora nicotianae P10297]|uniref:Uncharacterized protein n=1 Tax=Phytophthora nicotianae P10297 TaxID=1317064 RepID=W2ZZB7_PHYNI|nr:hypothetical protein F442_02379 [Phytophthora nicotianae P10297]
MATSEQDYSLVIEVETQRILVTFEKRIVLERCVGRNESDVPCVSRLWQSTRTILKAHGNCTHPQWKH